VRCSAQSSNLRVVTPTIAEQSHAAESGCEQQQRRRQRNFRNLEPILIGFSGHVGATDVTADSEEIVASGEVKVAERQGRARRIGGISIFLFFCGFGAPIRFKIGATEEFSEH